MRTVLLIDDSGEQVQLSDDMASRIALLFAVRKEVCVAPGGLCGYCKATGCSRKDAVKKLKEYVNSIE